MSFALSLVAAAVLSGMSTQTFAQFVEEGGQSITTDGVLNSVKVEGSHAQTADLSAEPSAAEKWMATYVGGATATGNNLSLYYTFNRDTSDPLKTAAAYANTLAINNADVTLSGDTTDIALVVNDAVVLTSATDSFTAVGVYGGGTLNFTAQETNITAENGDSLAPLTGLLLEHDGSEVSMTGQTVNINVTSATDETLLEPRPGENVKLYSQSGIVLKGSTNKLSTASTTTLNVNVKNTATDGAGAETIGFNTENSVVTLDGTTNITVETKSHVFSEIIGIRLNNDADKAGEQSFTNNGKLTVTATGSESYSTGVYLGSESDAQVTFTSNDTLNITATSNGSDEAKSMGLYFDPEEHNGKRPNIEVNLAGTTTITADEALYSEPDYGYEGAHIGSPIDSIQINVSGDLTLNGNVGNFKGIFNQTAGKTVLNAPDYGFFDTQVNLSGGEIDASDDAWGGDSSDMRISVSGGELKIGAMHISSGDALKFTGGTIIVTGESKVTDDEFNDEMDGNAFVITEFGTLSDTLQTPVNVTASGDSHLIVNGNAKILGSLTGLSSFAVNNGTLTTGQNATLNVKGSVALTDSQWVNQSENIRIEGDLTLTGTTLDGQNGRVESENIIIGNGSVVYDRDSVAANGWVLQTGGSYYFAENTFDENGLATIDNGWFEFAGGSINRLATGEMFTGALAVVTDPDRIGEEDYLTPQYKFSAGNYSFDSIAVNVESVGVEANARPGLVVSGGSVTFGEMNAYQGTASFSGGSIHADRLISAEGSFTVNAAKEGFTVGAFVGAEGGDFTLASGTMAADSLDLAAGKLTIATGATLSTYSGQIFTNGLNEEGTNADAGSLIYGNDHLVFAENGNLTLRDQFYNDDYAASAGSLLDGVNISFSGTAVDSDGEVITEKPIDDMTDGVTQETVTITAGADESGVVTVDKTIGGKDLVLDETVTNVTVTGGETLTLVGSAEGGDLVSFANEGETSVSVDGGLKLGGSENATKGTITSTVELGDSATLTASNGEFELSNVDANGASIEVASGSLTVDNLTLSGTSSLSSAANAVTTVSNVNVEEGTHQLKGEIAAETVTGSGTILVGSANEESPASATLNVDTLDHSGTIFIDPAWTDGAEMKDGSFLTVQQLSEEGDLKADVVAGQNSTFVFGADKAQAVDAFNKTDLTYGKDAVSAVLYVAKAINVTEGSITVDGSMAELGNFTGVAGSVTVAANGLSMIDAKALTDGAAITAKSVTFDEGSHIRVVNLTKNSEGTLIDADSLTIADSVLEDAASSSAIVSLKLENDGNGNLTYTTTLNKASEVFAGFEGAGLMDAMHEAAMNDVDSADRATKFLSRMAAYEDYGVSSAGSATAIGNQAMALAATAGVYNVALDASKLMNRAVDGRMSIANGLVHAEGATVWADVLATTNEAESLYGDSGYDVDLYGGVIGVDVGLGNGKLIGAAFTIGTGDGGSNGSAIDVDNDADFLGLSVYGSHRLGNFNGKVDLGYMHTKSDLSASAFGMSFGDEVKADAWTFGIGAEYLFNVGSINITPHVGIRWTRLEVDGYEGAFKTEDDSMDVFTAPVGVAFSGNIEAAGWTFAPKVDLSIVPSFGDDEATSKVRWGNVSQSLKTQVVDDAPVQATLGLNATNGSWTFGAFYDLGIGGDDRLDNAFSLKARYAF